jgi:hypothetical protein
MISSLVYPNLLKNKMLGYCCGRHCHVYGIPQCLGCILFCSFDQKHILLQSSVQKENFALAKLVGSQNPN